MDSLAIMETSYEDDSSVELLDREVEDTSVTGECRPIEVVQADGKDQGEKSEKSPEKHNNVSPMRKIQLKSTPVLKDKSQAEPRRMQDDDPDVLIFQETLIKHIGSKVEKGKNRLKWNGTLTDFKYFVSLVLKVIRFDPLAPVKTTLLLLPMEWKMPDFINNIE